MTDKDKMRAALVQALNPAKHYKRPHKTNRRAKWLRRKAWLVAILWGRPAAWRYLFAEWRREVFYYTWNRKRFAAVMSAPLRRMRNYTAMGRAIFKEEPLEAS